MKPSDVYQVHLALKAIWPERLVPDMTDDGARIVAKMVLEDVPLAEALLVVEEWAKRSSPFPPTWPELREAWQARSSGVAGDPAVIASEMLAEVNLAVRRVGSYRTPAWSDPIIGAAIRQAAGSWQAWCLTTNGQPGEGGAFTKNLEPERDERFRQAAIAMLQHRRRTGDVLPEIVRRAEQQRVTPGAFQRLFLEGDNG